MTRADDHIIEQLELVSDRFDFLDALDGAELDETLLIRARADGFAWLSG
ncbi:hypothetical protein [Haloferax sulfurifontis]|uniref:Uncharacterized protein n=1 Tax=Haloferax sulfurifontis TaxID=255616 RepID=A0A830EAQ4_9EURY|nr:hypothetical protein [Haloferax sulfurifontis]GGC72130.1 hypothetical protein GCM10007209_37560 [Haloferax sulfurifontis]